jgi:2,3-bisphosphoglycerate-independent phosphoglycerate mutase
VTTYDLQPEMSAAGVTDALLDAIRGDEYDFLVANYANADMVGHSGVWDATVRALEWLDGCIGSVAQAVLAADAASVARGDGGALLCVTADHGNADLMRDDEGRPVTAHSLNPVPFLVAGSPVEGRGLRDGRLADVAPTILELLGSGRLEGMTGTSLLTG